VRTVLVLVAGGESAIRTHAAYALETAGFSVALCEASDALRAATTIVPDVVVADVSVAIMLRGRLPIGRSGRTAIIDLVPHVDLVCARVQSAITAASDPPPPNGYRSW
jgi:CheY-like chemotaxis protein